MLSALIDISSKKEGKVLMRMSSRTGLALVAAILMHSGAAQAAGIGGYIEYSGYQNDLTNYGSGIDLDGNRIGVGVTYSTNPQGSALFNYRLDAGYVHTWEDARGYPKQINYNGFSLNNAFGFRVFQNSKTRVWIGPAVGLGVDVMSQDRLEDDVVAFTIGGGPQIGVNLAASESLTMAFTAGYQYRYRAEWYGDLDLDNDNAHGSGSYWLANIALMFNTGG